MTHSMTIELPEAAYQSSSERAEQKGKKAEEIVVETVESLTTSGEPNDGEFERLADYFEKSMPPDAKPLSDYAMSREGIYEDHL